MHKLVQLVIDEANPEKPEPQRSGFLALFRRLPHSGTGSTTTTTAYSYLDTRGRKHIIHIPNARIKKLVAQGHRRDHAIEICLLYEICPVCRRRNAPRSGPGLCDDCDAEVIASLLEVSEHCRRDIPWR